MFESRLRLVEGWAVSHGGHGAALKLRAWAPSVSTPVAQGAECSCKALRLGSIPTSGSEALSGLVTREEDRREVVHGLTLNARHTPLRLAGGTSFVRMGSGFDSL